MAWWRKKVVFPARRAWAAVSGRLRARKPGSGGIQKLHEDVQTCGYRDVQVMFEMLTSELEASHARKQPPSPHKPPVASKPLPAWSGRSSSTIAVAQ